MTRILYFGRVGERLGAEGQLDLPADGLPVREIRRLLAAQDEVAADALLRPDVRACVDLVIVGENALARPGQEIAFFSLVSGG
ncbi:MoaD/ThiS family protein [Brevundimonas sp.]|uniref:MoaD/ThiS family protein n=1 Tax=Brevundimonas sp. TaxID=1871086 RepID=UPI002CB064B9|nr:MoaD/ThiS family protein [Brevundimonas sp.]HWQ87647.1 MoaD/ThiS family protein [Brevundimonas sp.]